jgi:serine protease Do
MQNSLLNSAPLRLCVSLLLLTLATAPTQSSSAADDLALSEQQAFNAAAESVADCVVQIRTVGGLSQVDRQVLAQGPTSGLILTADGYIVSSAINFAQQPSSVLVQLPGGQQRPAEIVGHDTNRMLVLLKVKVDEDLPTPVAAPLSEVHVGDWAVAVGRTFTADRPNLSVGVVSALGRMHGRAVQSDVSASAANYGGPLVDLQGRVMGVLVPMSPQSTGAGETDELAGAEYYDSGIAFAVPLEHILGVLDRWIEAGDLKRGLLGVGMTDGGPHTTPPTITTVWPHSPADQAGWRTRDVIVAVEGEPVESQTQLRFRVAPRYAGDELEVTIRRGKGDDAEEIETNIKLAAELQPFRHAFLGVLPERGDTGGEGDENGVVVRAIWPESPAAKAGLHAADHITRLGDAPVKTLDDAFGAINALGPGDKLAVTFRRDDETREQTVELTSLPTDGRSASDLPKGQEDAANDAEAGAEAAPKLTELKLPDLPQTAHFWLPPGAGAPRGLLVWLSNGSDETNQALAAAWQEAATRDRLVLLMPSPSDEKGWSTDDLEFLGRLIPLAINRFGVDPRRVVVAGEGKAGQVAYVLAFKARRWVRGVAVIDSPLPRTLELPQNTPSQRLAVLSVETQNESLALLIRRDLAKLAEAGFPPTKVVRQLAGGDAHGELDDATRAKLARWIDVLDAF